MLILLKNGLPRADLSQLAIRAISASVPCILLSGCPSELYVDADGFFRKGGPVFFLENRDGCLNEQEDCVKGLASCMTEGVYAITSFDEITVMAPDGYGFQYYLEFVAPGDIPVAGCEMYLGSFAPRRSKGACDAFRQFSCAAKVEGIASGGLQDGEVSFDLVLESSLPLEACVREQAEAVGFDVERCLGRDGVDGEQSLRCQVYRAVLDRVDECIVERGPQSVVEGFCLGIFRAPPEDLYKACDQCYWWSSKECFEAVNSRVVSGE
jgi:hypothetical protein